MEGILVVPDRSVRPCDCERNSKHLFPSCKPCCFASCFDLTFGGQWGGKPPPLSPKVLQRKIGLKEKVCKLWEGRGVLLLELLVLIRTAQLTGNLAEAINLTSNRRNTSPWFSPQRMIDQEAAEGQCASWPWACRLVKCESPHSPLLSFLRAALPLGSF